MLARCARYPAATDRTLRLFPYFYFSQYGTRARAIRQRIARCAFSHISIFLNTAPAPAYPSATDRALRLFPYFYFSQYGPRARYPSATDRALRLFPYFYFFQYGTRSRAIRQRIARCAICPSSRAHPLKGSSTQIQMLIDSNSNAHRLKFKGSSTQIQMLIDSNAQKRDAPGRRDAQKLWQKCTAFYSRRKHIVK